MMIDIAIKNSMNDTMFTVKVDDKYTSAFIAKVFYTSDFVFNDSNEHTETPKYLAMKYEDFKYFADELYI
jgi:hypothetical protein